MIRLFYNYYEDNNILRKKEIDFCFQNNILNKSINLIIIESQNKLTYNDFFNKINQLAGPDDISVFCNSDIYLDETIERAKNMNVNDVYALSRWDLGKNNQATFCNRKDSQDCWVVRGPVRPVDGSFELGTPGCDNRIAFEFGRSGYTVTNPSISIKTYHVHNSNVRNYNKTSAAVPPPYLVVEPISL